MRWRAGLAIYLRSLEGHVLKRFDDDYETMTEMRCGPVRKGGWVNLTPKSEQVSGGAAL